MTTQCLQTGCRAASRWSLYRREERSDVLLYGGDACERHALAMTTEPGTYLRPTPAYADVAYMAARDRALRLAR